MATLKKQGTGFLRARVLAIALPGLVAMFASLLWAVESWQRPHPLATVRGEGWLAVACAGAAVGLLGAGWRMRNRWRLLLPAAVGFALFLPVAREIAAANAVRQLIEGLIADDSPPPSKFELARDALRQWLDDKKWPSRWLGKEEDQPDWNDKWSWACHRIEASRPDFRRRFALAAMRQDGPVKVNGQLAVAHWRWLFPAVTGQDVTLLSWDYLSEVFLPEATTPVRSCRRRGGPPALPLEPTPWQRARELHQRRQDLEFPDRAPLRRESGG